MKVTIYTRVSTDDQNPETQKQMIIDYCKREKHEIIGIYQDVYSGAKDSRPEFDRLLYDMRRRRFNGIIVYKLDRIGRSLQHLLQLFQDHRSLLEFRGCN